MKITNRLEKLKAEKEIIQNMKCLSFELRDKCLAWIEVIGNIHDNPKLPKEET